MAGPTFCPHSFACWGEIAQPCGCGYCRRRMSVTIQKETLAFYDYCLCVPPLKTRGGGIVHAAFLAFCAVARFQDEGLHRHFPLVKEVQWSHAKAQRPVSYQATTVLKHNLRACLLWRTHNHVYRVCNNNKGSRLCRIDFLQHHST